jgi:chromosomal replication initiation ATPase DnaA
MDQRDRLLFNKQVTVPLIQMKVAEARQVSITDMLTTNHDIGTRKMEFCKARQLSMRLSKKYTKLSLARIGWLHGERDHATVLSACRTIDHLVDTKDSLILDDYQKLDRYLTEYKEPLPKQENTIFNTEK